MINTLPGILLSLMIGAVAWFASGYIPLGGVTISLILGILVGNLVKLPGTFNRGTTFCEKRVLTWAIALTGISLDYKILNELGLNTLLLIIASVGLTIFAALTLGKRSGMNKDLCLLIGIGNAVCGSSAIAAAQGIIKTEDKNVGMSIAAINFLGTVGIFLVPALGLAVFRFSELQAGLLTGNTLQAIGQVTAAGYSISSRAGDAAVVVKMCRILMITPIVLILSTVRSRREETDQKQKLPRIPSYIIIFIILSIAGSTGLIPIQVISIVKTAEKVLLITAMAAIGMKISLKDLAAGGRQTLVLGSAVWGIQILLSSMVIQFLIR